MSEIAGEIFTAKCSNPLETSDSLTDYRGLHDQPKKEGTEIMPYIIRRTLHNKAGARVYLGLTRVDWDWVRTQVTAFHITTRFAATQLCISINKQKKDAEPMACVIKVIAKR